VVYVGDYVNKRIQKLTPDGAPAGDIPFWPEWVGAVTTIQELVVTANGEIVVLFSNPLAFDGPEPYYLVRYSASGRPLGQFGRSGPAPDGPLRPSGFDVAPDGTVWVADASQHRLVAFARDGRIVREIGGQGTEPGQFRTPGGVGIAPNGTLYVGDTGNNRVQVLSPLGAVRAVWDNSGPEYDQIQSPTRIRVGPDGSVFVARDGYGVPHRFQKFAPEGTLLAGAWLRPDSFAVTQDGNVIVEGSSSEAARRFNSNLEEYDPLVGVKLPPDAPGRLLRPNAIAFDAADNVYIADGEQSAVFVFASDGTPLSRLGERGFEMGQLRVPSGIVIAADGIIYVSDYALDRIYKYSPDWQLLDVWGGYGSGEGRLHFPNHLAIDPAGNVYVADLSNGRVQKFGPGGDVLAVWSGTLARGEASVGSSVAVDGQGRVYTYGSVPIVRRLLPDGSTDWSISAPERGSFSGMTVDDAGNLWLVDYQNGKLWKLGPDGQVLAVWGAGTRLPREYGPDFDKPNSVSVDRFGRVYVTEHSTKARVWRFTPEARP
jgi:DNA-binding beta-propeller fold protein YncE